MQTDLAKAVAESGWTHQALADAIGGVDRSTITRAIHKPSRREVIRARIATLIQEPPPNGAATAGAGE